MAKKPVHFDESLLKALLNDADIGIVAVSEEGIIQESNHGASELLNDSNLEGKLLSDFLSNNTQPDFLSFFKLLKSSENEELQKSVNLELENDESHRIHINLRMSRISSVENIYVGVLSDISLRRKLEKEVSQQKKKFESAERELQKEQELNELKSRFVSMASHEFRTPLAGILSSINLIKRYLDSEAEQGLEFTHLAKIDNHFEKVKESITNLTTILNEFLAIGKLEEGKISFIPEKVKVQELVKKVTDGLKLMKKKNQEFTVSYNNLSEYYILDKNMLRNILNNLLTNAIKYSDEEGEIQLEVREDNKELIIEVKDEGIGIPTEDQQNLFSQFYRAKNATNIQGTGLGLVIVKKYVEMMKGQITFTSELNKGSTFTVQIPV